MKNEILFNKWSRERIKLGIKRCTSRHKKYTEDKRVTWISPRLPWWFIRKYLWKDEGAKSSGELQTEIEKIYKRKVPDDEGFFVHFGNYEDEVER